MSLSFLFIILFLGISLNAGIDSLYEGEALRRLIRPPPKIVIFRDKEIIYKGEKLSLERFNSLSEGDIISTWLDSNSHLNIGGKYWARFRDYPRRGILIYITKGISEAGEEISLVERVEILRESGIGVEEQIIFGQIHEGGKLRDVFYRLSKSRFSTLNGVWLKNLYLDSDGKVKVITNKEWLISAKHPHYKVELRVVEGKVLSAHIIDEKGNLVKEIEFSPPLS